LLLYAGGQVLATRLLVMLLVMDYTLGSKLTVGENCMRGSCSPGKESTANLALPSWQYQHAVRYDEQHLLDTKKRGQSKELT
jgi:hypothetical protein